MPRFLHAHASHPQWPDALSLVLVQLEAQRRAVGPAWRPTLGWCYFTGHHAAQADRLLGVLRSRYPGSHWTGCVGAGVMGSGVEYLDEPGLSVMLCDLPLSQFQVFSGIKPLARAGRWHRALVHADGRTPELDELLGELAERTGGGALFGGLAAARTHAVHLADGVFTGGLSGVGFDASVAMLSRVAQGCRPVGPARRITAVRHQVVTRLDDRPALDCLLEDLGLQAAEPRQALPRLRGTLAGLSDPDGATAPGRLDAGTRMRHLIGLDPQARGVALPGPAEPGLMLTFCERHAETARRELVRICTEIREELDPETTPAPSSVPPGRRAAHAAPGPAAAAEPERPGPQRVAGAVYIACASRGGPHFGAPSAELQLIRHALGDVPLTGFFAGGEIAQRHLHGYAGVLTVFLED